MCNESNRTNYVYFSIKAVKVNPKVFSVLFFTRNETSDFFITIVHDS